MLYQQQAQHISTGVQMQVNIEQGTSSLDRCCHAPMSCFILPGLLHFQYRSYDVEAQELLTKMQVLYFVLSKSKLLWLARG